MFFQTMVGGGYYSRLKKFKEMLFTPKEVVEKAFGDGGQEFGANDELIQVGNSDCDESYSNYCFDASLHKWHNMTYNSLFF